MRLEYLCDMELEHPGNFSLLLPYGGEEGSGFGTGEGMVSGAYFQGSIRWANHPRRRSDGVMLPDTHAIICTDDRCEILFSLQGRTVFFDTEHGPQGQPIMTVLFEAEDERYRWLNNTLCIAEGQVNPDTLHLHIHVFSCISEPQQLPP